MQYHDFSLADLYNTIEALDNLMGGDKELDEDFLKDVLVRRQEQKTLNPLSISANDRRRFAARSGRISSTKEG